MLPKSPSCSKKFSARNNFQIGARLCRRRAASRESRSDFDEDSRSFCPRFSRRESASRERRLNMTNGIFTRRYATHSLALRYRGLKPTATIKHHSAMKNGFNVGKRGGGWFNAGPCSLKLTYARKWLEIRPMSTWRYIVSNIWLSIRHPKIHMTRCSFHSARKGWLVNLYLPVNKLFRITPRKTRSSFTIDLKPSPFA